MKSQILIRSLMLALGLSILFNIFVLIGFVQSKTAAQSQSQSPADTLKQDAADDKLLEQITTELKLDPKQAKVLADLRTDHRKQAAEFEEAAATIRQNILNELKNDSPDFEKVRSLLTARAELERDRRVTGVDHFGKFLRELTPQQRRMFAHRFGPPPGAPPPPRAPGAPGGPNGPRQGRPGNGPGAPLGPRGGMPDNPDGPPNGHSGGPPGGPQTRGDRVPGDEFAPGLEDEMGEEFPPPDEGDMPGGFEGPRGAMNPQLPQPPPPIRLEDFDLNHNGVLEADEMQAAQKELDARRERRNDRINPPQNPRNPGGRGLKRDGAGPPRSPGN